MVDIYISFRVFRKSDITKKFLKKIEIIINFILFEFLEQAERWMSKFHNNKQTRMNKFKFSVLFDLVLLHPHISSPYFTKQHCLQIVKNNNIKTANSDWILQLTNMSNRYSRAVGLSLFISLNLFYFTGCQTEGKTCNEGFIAPEILEGINATYQGCLESCANVEGCKFFTFYTTDDTLNCYHFGDSCNIETPCVTPSAECTTGDLACEI